MRWWLIGVLAMAGCQTHSQSRPAEKTRGTQLPQARRQFANWNCIRDSSLISQHWSPQQLAENAANPQVFAGQTVTTQRIEDALRRNAAELAAGWKWYRQPEHISADINAAVYDSGPGGLSVLYDEHQKRIVAAALTSGYYASERLSRTQVFSVWGDSEGEVAALAGCLVGNHGAYAVVRSADSPTVHPMAALTMRREALSYPLATQFPDNADATSSTHSSVR